MNENYEEQNERLRENLLEKYGLVSVDDEIYVLPVKNGRENLDREKSCVFRIVPQNQKNWEKISGEEKEFYLGRYIELEKGNQRIKRDLREIPLERLVERKDESERLNMPENR